MRKTLASVLRRVVVWYRQPERLEGPEGACKIDTRLRTEARKH